MRSAPRNASSTQNDWRNLRRRSQQAWQRLQPSSQYFRFSQPNGRPTVHAVRRFAIIQIQKEISHSNTRQTLHGGSNARQAAKLEAPKHQGLDRDTLIHLYRTMYLSRRLDDREIQLKRQNKIFFQISSAGHEAVTAAAGLLLRPGIDWLYPYYRDRALCLMLGVTPLETLLQAVGAKDDPSSGGRQMPSHWGHRKWNIVSKSSCTGTQFVQAVGAAETTLYYGAHPKALAQGKQAPLGEGLDHHEDEIVYVSSGDGATSEGEFWESLNAACAKKLPLFYLIEDNGYAISVPIEVQTAGASISKLVRGFPGLHVAECDGTDPLESYSVCARPARPCVGARPRHQAILAFPFRR